MWVPTRLCVCVCVCTCVQCVRACMHVCMCAQSYLTLCDPVDLPGSSVLEFSRQEYWSGLPCSPPGDLPHPGIKPTSLSSPALAGGFFTTMPPGNMCSLAVARELFPPISSFPAVYRSRNQCRIKLLAQDPYSLFLHHRVAWMRQETICENI